MGEDQPQMSKLRTWRWFEERKIDKNMENPTWCSLDGPCNISEMIVDIVQNGSSIVQNFVQNRSMDTTTINLTSTACNGSMVNGECMVRYQVMSCVWKYCGRKKNIILWWKSNLKIFDWYFSFRQKRLTLLQCPHGAR